MDIDIQIDESFTKDIEPHLIEDAVKRTLQLSEQAETSLTVLISHNEFVQQLNNQFRGINLPTDVLSFANESDPDFPEFEADYLGDVVIAYPVAQAQALAAGHTPMDEVILLVVHGTLHLLGFDHDTPLHKEKMWAAQQQILTELGLAHLQPT